MPGRVAKARSAVVGGDASRPSVGAVMPQPHLQLQRRWQTLVDDWDAGPAAGKDGMPEVTAEVLRKLGNNVARARLEVGTTLVELVGRETPTLEVVAEALCFKPGREDREEVRPSVLIKLLPRAWDR